MDNKEILAKIENLTEEKGEKKYLKCEQAFKLAEDLDIAVGKIGQICNQEGIKIKSCQLGCF